MGLQYVCDGDGPGEDMCTAGKIDPDDMPTEPPTEAPTPLPTPIPTALPTPEPTPLPTPVPTALPTPEPTLLPTPVPTELPTPEPTPPPPAPPAGPAACVTGKQYNSQQLMVYNCDDKVSAGTALRRRKARCSVLKNIRSEDDRRKKDIDSAIAASVYSNLRAHRRVQQVLPAGSEFCLHDETFTVAKSWVSPAPEV